MNPLLIAITGYFLLAVESIADKFLLSGKVKSWQLYVFYVGLLSGAAVILVPFGVTWPGSHLFLISILSGMIFFAFLAFLFHSLKDSSASRVYVLMGAVTTVITLFLARIFIKEEISLREITGIGLLLLGGLLISFKVNQHKFFKGFKSAFISGVLSAMAVVMLKYVFEQEGFINGYVYSRIGVALATLGLLLSPSFRNEIFCKLRKDDRKESATQFLGVLGAKAIAGIGSLMINYSISKGSVTLVNALISVQYLFTFIFSVFLSLFFKRIFSESLSGKSLFFKILGVVLVGLGVLMVR